MAGKSTLLDILSERKGGRVCGQVRVLFAWCSLVLQEMIIFALRCARHEVNGSRQYLKASVLQLKTVLFKSNLWILSVILCTTLIAVCHILHAKASKVRQSNDRGSVAQVLMNGLPLGQTFQRHSVYVPQEGHLRAHPQRLGDAAGVRLLPCTSHSLCLALAFSEDSMPANTSLASVCKAAADHAGQQPPLLSVAGSCASNSCTRRPAHSLQNNCNGARRGINTHSYTWQRN